MEQNNSYARYGGSLRDKSPRNRSANSHRNQVNEQEYELRRQQELRRQIEMRERELEIQQSNRERLQRHTNQSSRPDLSKSSEPRFAAGPEDRYSQYKQAIRSSNSPLRGHRSGSGSIGRPQVSNVTINDMSVSGGSTIPTRPEGRRSNEGSHSPLRLQQYLGPTQERDIPQGLSGRLAPTEYLAQLRRDNESLQRRLNLVLAELDRINREKGTLNNRLSDVMNDVNHLQRNVDESSASHDQNNRVVQIDLSGQKSVNVDVKQRVQAVEGIASDALSRVRMAVAERERLQRVRDEQHHDLNGKILIVSNMERDRSLILEQLASINAEINSLNTHGLSENHLVRDMQLDVDRLLMERDDLQAKYEILNRDYDTTAHEIGTEFTHTANRNNSHQKLLVSKTAFQLLEAVVIKRKQNAMNEFFNYCRFDQRCHSTLKRFVGILHKLGHYKMRIGLKQWFQKTFKPIENIEQQHNIVDMRYCNHLLRDMFYNWRRAYQNKTSAYTKRLNALNRIWALKKLDVGKEVGRAFTIWKDAMLYDKMQEHKMKHRLLELYRTKLYLAWQRWTHYNNEQNWQIRMHLLARQFAQDQLLQITFTQLKNVTADRKRKKNQVLRTYLNAWKTSIQYRKYMMASNMAAAKFLMENSQVTMKQCFDALRHNKETEKLSQMNQLLHDETIPAINDLNGDIAHRLALADAQTQSRARDCITRMLYRQTASYFFKWKGMTDGINTRIVKNLMKMFVRRDNDNKQRAFKIWLEGHQWNKITVQQNMIQELQFEGAQITDNSLTLDKKINVLKNREDRSGRNSLRRACDIYNKRRQKNAMDQWRNLCEFTTKQEEGSECIKKKMRNRFLKQAFKLYHEGVKWKMQKIKDDARCEHFRETLRLRESRKIFNAWCSFNHKFKKSKVYWSLLLNKMDNWMKKRAFSVWQNQGNRKVADELKAYQQEMVMELDGLEKQSKDLEVKHQRKVAKNKTLDQSLRRQGGNVMATYFARWYNTKLSRAFTQWNDAVKFQNHKDSTIKRVLQHWKNYKFQSVKAAFQNFVMLQRRNEVKANLKHRTMEREEAEQMNKHQAELHAGVVEKLTAEQDETQAHADLLNQRVSMNVQMIMRRNQENYFVDNRRYIIQHWRAYVARQKAFTTAIKNALLKSMWNKGFTHIKAFSRDKQETRIQNKKLTKIRRMFWQRNCGSAFTQWRNAQFIQAKEITQEFEFATNNAVEMHTSKRKQIRQKNCDRSSRIIKEINLRNYIAGWRNVTKWLKQNRLKTQEYKESENAYMIKRALSRWNARTKHVHAARHKVERLKRHFGQISLQLCFNALKTTYQNEKRLSQLCSSIAKKFDSKGLNNAFKQIRQHGFAHTAYDNNRKAQSSRNLSTVLKDIWRRRMTSYYSTLRNNCFDAKKKLRHKMNLFMHANNRSLRGAFDKWRKVAEAMNTVDEVNQIGPVVEEVLEHKLDCRNLQNFMRKEGYTDDQVAYAAALSKKRADNLLSRSIARMKHYNEELYVVPKMFDRWRMYVKMRKMMLHWMHYIGNRQQPVRSDLAVAFDRWKYSHGKAENLLSRRPKEYLDQRCILAAKRLNDLADNNNRSEYLLSQLGIQRDELTQNKLLAQKLSFSLHNNNTKVGMHQAMMKWSDGAHLRKRTEYEGILARNLQHIAGLKDKIRELESDNEALANQNEEMRQISLDGYQIARNVQNLNSEREKLSVDLADKTTMIKKLLDENEKLSVSLRVAQDDVHGLRQTRHRMTVTSHTVASHAAASQAAQRHAADRHSAERHAAARHMAASHTRHSREGSPLRTHSQNRH